MAKTVFTQAYEGLSDIEELKIRLERSKEAEYLHLAGVTDAGKALTVNGIGQDYKTKVVITAEEQRAKDLYEELSYFDENALYIPGKDLLFFQSDIRGNAITIPRVRTLQRILQGGPVTVVTTISAVMNRLPEPSVLEQGFHELKVGDRVDLVDLRKLLSADGYEPVQEVSEQGEYAVRGGIVDIFPLTEDYPLRIEFWDDEIDSIKYFDAGTQRSTENIQSFTLTPAMEFVLDSKAVLKGTAAMKSDADHLYEVYRKEMKTEEAHRIRTTIDEVIEKIDTGWIRQEAEVYLPYFTEKLVSVLDYLPEDTLVFLDEGRHIDEAAKMTELEFTDSMTRRLEQGYLLPRQLELVESIKDLKLTLGKHSGVILTTLDQCGKLIKSAGDYHISMQSGTSYNNSFPLLTKELRALRKKHARVLLLSQSRTRGQRIAKDLASEEIMAFYSEDIEHMIQPGEIMVSTGQVRQGFEFPDSNFVIISESDIFGQKPRKKKRKKFEGGEKISAFRDLHPGDYVVHENHGLGIYRGLEKIEVDNVMKDYIKIEYAKGGNLYVLATQLDTIQKYGDADGKKPRLNSLGGQEWEKTKAKVQSGVGLVARELVDLYAARRKETGYAFSEDTEWQKEFEEAFPYEETEGQLSAIADVKRDMMSSKIMDRLICGDVGFGKTEIAMRAAFKAVQDGKQVVVLVPTTILAEQHYNNFTQRMSAFGPNIELLSRFRTPSQVKKSLKNIESGFADIVIGTHRVLSKDVKFKDLGLLIIAEEQRFGVGHKEKIKQLRKNVDVLSLSATPIPRTLHMSLVGIRDMSLLEEAPMDRQPIQTFVFEYNTELIREAIARELSRGGQVYYVINRVKNIADVADRIQAMVPDANVSYAHGQMNETQLEDIMMSFVNKEIDVLVATTIIEIGLDISNVNTIIIHDADKMGLSQLYQLRGRVGRSSRTAYAFFLYKKDKILKEDAEKRLSAIREFTDLGSGFKIALRDLEIRGAGNMLGREQHGHMEAVGYDLYCKMLNEAVRREKGEEVEEDFDTVVEIDIDAYIPKSYISDEMQKLDIYKRIAAIRTEEEYEDMYDELLDRFREPPKAVMNLLRIALLRGHAKKAYIQEIRQKPDLINIRLFPKAKIDITGIPKLVEKYAPYLTFRPDKENPGFVFDNTKDSRIRKRDVCELLQEFSDSLYEYAVQKTKAVEENL